MKFTNAPQTSGKRLARRSLANGNEGWTKGGQGGWAIPWLTMWPLPPWCPLPLYELHSFPTRFRGDVPSRVVAQSGVPALDPAPCRAWQEEHRTVRSGAQSPAGDKTYHPQTVSGAHLSLWKHGSQPRRSSSQHPAVTSPGRGRRQVPRGEPRGSAGRPH